MVERAKPLVIYEYQLERLRPLLGNMVEGRDYVVAPNRIPKDADSSPRH